MLFALYLFRGHQTYDSDQRISEKINWEINSEKITCIGESFRTEISISKLYKVTESEKWFFIWYNKNHFSILSKNSLNIEMLSRLKNLLRQGNIFSYSKSINDSR